VMKTSAQRLKLVPSQFFAVLNARIAALEAQGKEIIRLDIGSPDLPPAPHIVSALARSAATPDSHGYQHHQGPLALRQAWAEMYRGVHEVELDPGKEVIPLLGSKEGIFHLAQALLDPGDVALIPDPGYITYTSGTVLAGGLPYCVPLLRERGYLPDLDAVPPEALRNARLLWLNYPNNPTAATASRDFFAAAVEFARRHALLVCHDAAYAQVTFDGYRAPSILEIPGAKEVAVEFNSLSKSHNMAGWRVGAAVGNAQALKSLYAYKTNADSGHFRPIQQAAIAAMTGDQGWLAERNAVYRQRRDCVLSALRSLGLDPATPKASLYVWCPIPTGFTSQQFATHLLEEAGVSLTPGTVFGQQGEGFVRIALTSPIEQIEAAMQRIRTIL
jgi:LL-diaminopimelate aminotransferase